MSKKLNIILWLVAFFILAISILISRVKPQFIYDSLDTEEIRAEIQSIIDKADSDKNIFFNQSFSNLFTVDNLGENTAYECVLQEADSIVYWSSNKVDFDKLKTISQPGIYSLSGRIYWLWVEDSLNRKVYYLIPLKRNLEFENSFLQNTSFSNLYIPKNYLPTRTQTDLEIEITVQNQNYKFYFEILESDKILRYWEYILVLFYALSLVLLIFLLFQFLNKVEWKYYWRIFVWVLLLLLVRLVFLNPSFIPFVNDFYLFKPFDFANSFIPSLGMLVIDAVWLYVLVLYGIKIWSSVQPKFNFTQSLIAQVLGFGFFLILVYSIYGIIINSTSNFIDFDTVLLRYQDILLLLVFGILVLLFIKILLFILHHTLDISAQKFLRFTLVLYLPLLVIFLIFDWHLLIIPLFVIVSGWLISLRSNLFFSRQTIRLVLIFLGSIFVVSFVEYISSEKELANKSLRLDNYQVENNRLAEYLLNDLDSKIVSDSVLLGLLYQLPDTSEQYIYDYINIQHFTGFWSQYDEDITICGSSNVFKEPNDINSCRSFFDKKTENSAKVLSSSHFIAITDYGIDNYLGKFQFIKGEDSTLIDLYILLKPKEQQKNLGYPSFLLSQEVDKANEQQYYSFAKYKNGTLASRMGTYNYSLNNPFPKDVKRQDLVKLNGYYHLVEQQAPGVFNVISSKQQTVWDFFIILSYVFVLYAAVFYFVELLSLFAMFEFIWINSLKDKLRLSFLGLLVVTFIVVAAAVISKSTDLSEQKQKNILNEKMQSVLVELMHKLSQSEELQNLNIEYLNYLFVKFSNVFFTDINLYDLSGKLIASSRAEVFEKGLIGNRMNSTAFATMAIEKKSEFIHIEKIGKQQYLSAYIPFRNSQNNTIAYLNLPYFAKDKEIQSDVTTLVTAFLNIFVLLFLITGIFTIFITNRITLPLAIIQQKLKDFSLGRKNETIVYKSKDEIGALVAEYNRTVEELNKNIELLAQKEREGAWKEMAKQIAHEIKNPLTPMKLSLQHLKHIWKDDRPGKDEKLNDTVDLLVRQIDNLAEIATAFSDFSKMIVATQRKFNITDLIQDQVELYSKEAKIVIQTNFNNDVLVFADEQQISRVIQNLLKNAIQAALGEVESVINIEIVKNDDLILIKICDNGVGMNQDIQEHLFEPNFTTKNSGMGLGLAIVKQIVENNSGKITFETKEGKGTCFSLFLPKA